MLKTSEGLVLRGEIDQWTEADTMIVEASQNLVTIIIECDNDEFEDKAIMIVQALAEKGLIYGEKYVISRVISYES